LAARADDDESRASFASEFGNAPLWRALENFNLGRNTGVVCNGDGLVEDPPGRAISAVSRLW
jgi:hypothetical protein